VPHVPAAAGVAVAELDALDVPVAALDA
jgi:hypothetical protein